MPGDCRRSPLNLPTDTPGWPHTLVLTPGHASDMTGADLLLPGMPKTRYLIADKGYDAEVWRHLMGS